MHTLSYTHTNREQNNQRKSIICIQLAKNATHIPLSSLSLPLSCCSRGILISFLHSGSGIFRFHFSEIIWPSIVRCDTRTFCYRLHMFFLWTNATLGPRAYAFDYKCLFIFSILCFYLSALFSILLVFRLFLPIINTDLHVLLHCHTNNKLLPFGFFK